MTAPVRLDGGAVRAERNLFIACMAGFVATSMLCGGGRDPGADGGVPCPGRGCAGRRWCRLSQATMLDIYPFERRGPGKWRSSAWAGHGGADPGPDLGRLSDRGLQLALGVLRQPAVRAAGADRPDDLHAERRRCGRKLRFDWTGFRGGSRWGVGALQLMLDRGQRMDWFTSREIIIEAVLAALGFYLFIVHMMTADKPVSCPRRCSGIGISYAGVLMVFLRRHDHAGEFCPAGAPIWKTLAGYPVATGGAGDGAPAGLGTMIGMLIAARLSQRLDQRAIMAAGLLTMGWALYAMSAWTPDITERQDDADAGHPGFSRSGSCSIR